MHHIKVIKDGNVNKVVKEQLVDGVQYVDDEPREGSLNGITSGAVAKIAGDVGEVAERVTTAERDIDTIEGKIPSGASSSNKLVTESDLEAAQDRWQTGFTPKGEATVSAINALTTQSNGDQYIVTDSGTITAGSISVVAGDTVAWNATDEVWYKVNQYVTKTEFEEYKDALDGTAKSDSVTKEYDPGAGVGEGGYCMNEGHLYQANEMMSGDFDATKCTKKEVYEVLMQQIEQQKIMLSAIESQQTNLERPEGYIPDVGDAVWVGDDGKKHFFKGDTVDASSLTSAGLTFVGVVSLKRANKVWVLNNSENSSIRFTSCWAWEITGVAYNESNTIQFRQRGLTSAGATTYTDYDVGDPFTFTPTDIDDAVSKIDTFLRANQGGKSYNSLIVCNYHWHCAKIDGRIWVISDFGESDGPVDDLPSSSQYESQVVNASSSGSISSKNNMWELAGFTNNYTTLQRIDGKVGGSTLWNVYRAKQYMASNGNIGTPTDTVPTESDGIYAEVNFTESNCPNTYNLYDGDYTNYLEHMLLKYPASAGAVKAFAGTAKSACDDMDAVKYVPYSGGSEVNMFSAVHYAKTLKAHPTASVSGMNAGDWYVPGLDESFEIFCQMKVDGTDVINKAFVRSNGSVVSLLFSRWLAVRKYNTSAWYFSNYGYFGNYHFNYAFRVSAVALLEF